VNMFVINFTCCIYMWVDFIENIYQYGKCESISSETTNGKDETTRRLPYYIAYKVLSAIPLSIFSAFIVITLTYKSVINLIDYIFRSRSNLTRMFIKKKSHDSFCCLLANVDDDAEIIYSINDLEYVNRLLAKHKEMTYEEEGKEDKEKNKEKMSISSQQAKNYTNRYAFVEKPKKSAFYRFSNKIYKWDPTFRFTSRYLNTITVALVSLYYIFLYWTYTVSMTVTELVIGLPAEITTNGTMINLGDILCNISSSICLEQLQALGPVPIPLPDRIIEIYPSVKSSILSILIVPAFGAYLFCLLQIFFLVKETRNHLRQMHQGNCEFVRKAVNLNKNSIASSSFHFGGYLVGFLIWGYVILYIAIVILGAVILAIRIFAGDVLFAQIALRLVPVLTVILFKRISNFIASNYAFLYRDSKMLALNNFRAFNVFLYFNFYFDFYGHNQCRDSPLKGYNHMYLHDAA
jgi:hypothetical protein